MSVRLPESLRVLLTRKMLICVFTGFSSGLPLYLLLNLLPAWMRSEGVDLKTIGFFALIQFPYTWKFLWSPFLDRYAVPLLGRRRGWTFLMQIGLLLTIGSLGGLSPTANITPVLWLAALLALFSATQDIALDAFRIESADANHQAAQRGGGFVDFVFPKPGAGDVFKLGYAEAIGGTPFWIGTGVYIDNVDKAESHLITTMRSLLHSKLAAYGFGFLAILLLVVCPLSYVMVVSITRPLAGITRHARAVAQGKGTFHSHAFGGGEGTVIDGIFHHAVPEVSDRKFLPGHFTDTERSLRSVGRRAAVGIQAQLR